MKQLPADDPARIPGITEATVSWLRNALDDDSVSADDNFLEIGGHSIMAMELGAWLKAEHGINLDIRQLFEENVGKAVVGGRAAEPETATDNGDGHELSHGERRFWLAERLAPGAPGHVAISRAEISGPVDAARLARALASVCAAHPSLRTRFPIVDGQPRRTVGPAQPTFPVLYRDAWTHPKERAFIAELAAQVHDLAEGPLVAAGLMSADEHRHLLLLAVHHAVYDGHSDQVLLTDLARAWSGIIPEPAPAPRSARRSDAADLEFWRAECADLVELALPDTGGLPMRQIWRAPVSDHALLLPSGARRLRWYATRHRVPALAVPLAAWWRTLTDWTARSDLCVGTVVANRGPCDERVVGYLANSLPIRIADEPAGDDGVDSADGSPEFALVARVGAKLLDVLEHAAVPTDEIAALAPRPSAGRMPLFQTILVLQRVRAPVRLGELTTVRPRPAPPMGAQAELCCALWEDGDDLTGSVHAPRGLLPEPMLRTLAAHFEARLVRLLDTELP
jgi:mycobactin peptide synthetase MbtE